MKPQCQQQGAASSAAKYRRNGGVEDKSSNSCFIPGEGWVKWIDLSRQVDVAFSDWLARSALKGRYLFDSAERRVAEIGVAMDRKVRGITGNHFDDAHPLR